MHAQNDAAQRLYQEGIFQMEAMGDFSAAIELFEKLVSEHPHNKSLASRALLMAGRCYEKLGQEEAEKAYKRILEDYGDQREVVNEARVRLMALTVRTRPSEYKGIITRRIWQGPEMCGWTQLSHDEKYIAFTDPSTNHLALLDLETREQRLLTHKGPETDGGALIPFFSPDGKHIVYTWYNQDQSCEFRMLNLENGEVKVLMDSGFIFLSTIAWSPDGEYIALITTNNEGNYILGLYDMEKKTYRKLKLFEEYFLPMHTAFSPNGKYLAYERSYCEINNCMNIYTIDLATKEHYELVTHPSENFVFDWTPDGTQLVFISNRTGVNAIYAIPVKNGRIAGEIIMLKTDISQAITPIRITQAGSLYYGLDSGGRDVYTAAFKPDDPEPFGPTVKISRRFEGANRAAAFSNDGKYVAYVSARQQRPMQYSKAVVIQNMESGFEREVVLDVTTFFDYISWLPDNESVVLNTIYMKDRQRHYALFILNTTTGQVTDTIEGGINGYFIDPVWSQDGKYMYFLRGNYVDLKVIFAKRNMETGVETVLFDPAESSDNLDAGSPMFRLVSSNDQNMLAFSRRSTIERRSDLFLIDLEEDNPEPVTLLTINAPEVISRTFSFEGDQVFFIKSQLDERNVQRDPELWSFNIATGESRKIVSIPEDFLFISLHPDGSSALFNMGPRMNPCEIWAIDNLLPNHLNE
ncbi:MAG: tetratricopeptide repeat protein [Bacteroidales bacterium]|nr:tetratricopeptide repeat protein [Bacteroidales bacterium]